MTTGSLSFSADDSTLQEQIGGTEPGISYDQVLVNGTVSLSGANLDLQLAGTSSTGSTYAILINDGSDAVTGTFSYNGQSLAGGDSFTTGGRTFQISYTANVDGGSSGNDITLTDVTQTPPVGGGGPTPGNDNLIGTPADDTISLLAGNDTYSGLAGADLVYGNMGADVIYGNMGADLIFGGQDNDLIFGGQDNDTLYGNMGADIVYGNMGNDVVYGNMGADTLYGGQGNDKLYGGQDNDVLFGNKGADTLVGGLGSDTFGFNVGDTDFKSGQGTGDTIADFVTGTDQIDFTSGPAGSAANFGAGTSASTSFADIQASAQAIINGGKTYAFVTDGTDGYLFTSGGAGGTIEDAVKLTGAATVDSVNATDIHGGPPMAVAA